ncbi:MAG TPA: hypothetical protein G4O08_11735 [Anaerolineae bacterium]|nr:hypothetical protein [Anaerolineae bacterium]
MDVFLPPGRIPDRIGPLKRFLPPMEQGVVTRALEDLEPGGDVVLDPFGASPQLVRELAAAGKRVLIAANNPVTRFVLRHTLEPIPINVLQTALAHMATTPKDGSRMEPFLLDLYRTRCSRCGETISADFFVWDREEHTPVLRAYACASCGLAVEEAATEEDRRLAQSFEGRSLHYALALQRVVPARDPDQRHAEAALAIYPGRALYALTALMNKMDRLSLDAGQQPAMFALLLSCFDAGNALWDHPEGRARPLQLSASAYYKEANLWRAMERAVSEWALVDNRIACDAWSPGKDPEAGGVALFPGAVRDLAPNLPAGSVDEIITVLPRPNQAYWTLSALWSAWLWGRQTATPIMAALRRRRYDWGWHATALRAALNHARPVIKGGGPVMAFIPEAEPGFISAALAGFDKAGFAITGRALRQDMGQALFRWTAASSVTLPIEEQVLAQRSKAAATDLLRSRGEPTPYAILHAAVWSDLAQRRLLSSCWQKVGTPPLAQVGDAMESALEDRNDFSRLDPWSEIESGSYWLTNPRRTEPPLADRVERLVVDLLRQFDALSAIEVESRTAQALPGLLTPDRGLVLACLRSYAERQAGMETWRMRDQERREERQRDCDQIGTVLMDLGKRLGYAVRKKQCIEWRVSKGPLVYRFQIQASAAMGEILADAQEPRLTLVIPGGRSSLLNEKARRDARIKAWLERDNCVVKFRHVRRLAADRKLRRENFAECLVLDPPEQQDPQMRLL